MKTSAKFLGIYFLWMGVFFLFFNCRNFSKKSYTFHRKMLNQPLYKPSKEFIIKSNSHFIAANELICSYKYSQDTAMISYYDTDNFNELDSFQIINSHFRRISYFDLNHIFFIHKFILYNFSVHKRLTNVVPVNNFKIFSMVPINSMSNQLLLFGELKVPSGYQTGFYIFNTLTQKITSSKTLEFNKNSAAFENVLIYSGKFSVNNGRIIYICDKFSEIYFFNPYGKFKNKITTKDHTHRPVIISNELGYFYKRGSTHNTNNGLFALKDSIFVFSSRTKKKQGIMIDIYSCKTRKYLFSNKLLYDNKTSTDINFVLRIKNEIMIGFDNKIVVFK